jgi:hypothetical protein
MKLLPHWSLTGSNPAFYDTESATAIEQTAKVYGAMQTLITEYNAFVDAMNKEITSFEDNTKADIEQFKSNMIKIMNDYTECMDTKIDTAILYMMDNIVGTTTTLVNEALADGRIVITEQYDPNNESLNITGGV